MWEVGGLLFLFPFLSTANLFSFADNHNVADSNHRWWWPTPLPSPISKHVCVPPCPVCLSVCSSVPPPPPLLFSSSWLLRWTSHLLCFQLKKNPDEICLSLSFCACVCEWVWSCYVTCKLRRKEFLWNKMGRHLHHHHFKCCVWYMHWFCSFSPPPSPRSFHFSSLSSSSHHPFDFKMMMMMISEEKMKQKGMPPLSMVSCHSKKICMQASKRMNEWKFHPFIMHVWMCVWMCKK